MTHRGTFLLCMAALIAQLFASTGTFAANQPHESSPEMEMEPELLQLMTREQLEAYRNGTSPSEILLATGETLEEFLEVPQKTPTYSLIWISMTGGGGESSGGVFDLEGTSGQTLTGEASGGGYKLTVSAANVNMNLIFSDGFETGSTSNWDATVSALTN